MKILKISGIALATIASFYLILITLLPSEVYVERSILVDASSDRIFSYLENLENFQEWAYWAEIDPNTEYQYSGAPKGIGSRMDWNSDHIGMGYGSLWITSTIPHSNIQCKIQLREFAKPATMNFQFTESDGSTKITWNFQTNFYGYWKFFIYMMEPELGPAYEKGLSKIKRNLEKTPNDLTTKQ